MNKNEIKFYIKQMFLPIAGNDYVNLYEIFNLIDTCDTPKDIAQWFINNSQNISENNKIIFSATLVDVNDDKDVFEFICEKIMGYNHEFILAVEYLILSIKNPNDISELNNFVTHLMKLKKEFNQ